LSPYWFSGAGVVTRGENMDIKELGIEIVAAAQVRRSFVDGRDIRGDVEFQNDVNALLARVEHLQMPWRSLSDLSPSPLPSAIVADNTPLPVRRPAVAGLGRLPALVVAPRGPVAARR
jgi:hypothetical protein